MATDSCRPRLYVYRLPEAYRNRLFPERARDVGEPIFRDAVAWPEFPDVALWNSAMCKHALPPATTLRGRV